jgi:hypothetical protein
MKTMLVGHVRKQKPGRIHPVSMLSHWFFRVIISQIHGFYSNLVYQNNLPLQMLLDVFYINCLGVLGTLIMAVDYSVHPI